MPLRATLRLAALSAAVRSAYAVVPDGDADCAYTSCGACQADTRCAWCNTTGRTPTSPRGFCRLNSTPADCIMTVPAQCTVAPGCTTLCGRAVPDGWQGDDDGDDACNTCTCKGGNLGCTKRLCPKKACAPVPRASGQQGCVTHCGRRVADGWSGDDDGDDACNRCQCHDGRLGCTLQLCPKKACPGPAPTPPGRKGCTTACGRAVPDGWEGADDGGDACNSCECHDGVMMCTEMACPERPCPGPAPAPAPGCVTHCGRRVAEGWSGDDDGDDACNACTCHNGHLGCTKKLCPKQACPK